MAFADQQAALERLFTSRRLDDAWFSAIMLKEEVPAAIVRAVGRLRADYGDLAGIERQPDHFRVTLARAEVPAIVALDPQGRVAGFLLRTATPTTGSLASFVEAIAALPGRTACLVATDGIVRHDHGADLPLAVGSAFKLAVLQAAAQAVGEGRLAWDGIVALEAADRSLPSGLLQDWPDGARLTLESLAALMISISDNTATDAMVRLVGKDAIERIAPGSKPFLTTREAFRLKGAARGAERAEWLAGDEAARRALLARIEADPLPAAQDIAPGGAPEIEWFMSARELQGCLAATRDLAAFRINAGPADPRRWGRVAFKGGSESDVLNLSIALTGLDGREHVVVATWNAPEEIDPEGLMVPFLGLLHALRVGG